MTSLPVALSFQSFAGRLKKEFQRLAGACSVSLRWARARTCAYRHRSPAMLPVALRPPPRLSIFHGITLSKRFAKAISKTGFVSVRTTPASQQPVGLRVCIGRRGGRRRSERPNVCESWLDDPVAGRVFLRHAEVEQPLPTFGELTNRGDARPASGGHQLGRGHHNPAAFFDTAEHTAASR